LTGARIEIMLEDKGLRGRLGVLAQRLEDPADLYDAIGAVLASGVQRRFIAAKDPEGALWKQSGRARHGRRGGKTLTDTGRLQQSIAWSVQADGVLVGTNVKYAAIHQFGGEIVAKNASALAFTLADGTTVVTKKVTMPARPFLGVDAEDRAAAGAVMRDWLEAALPMTGP